MTPDYVAIILSLPIVYLLFRFASRPTYKMLSAFLTLSVAYFIAINHLYIITLYSTLRIILLYSIACYFILSFMFQNNVYRYYSNVLAFSVGWEELKIPLILWEFSDDFSFISILGIPIWRPFSYISKLRNFYKTIDIAEFEKSQNPIVDSITKECQIQVTGCKFIHLVREDIKEKYGNCYLFFFGPLNITEFIGYADSSLLKVKPVRGSQDSYNVSYISMLGLAPKLNHEDSYDLFGKFIQIPTEDKQIPGIYLRAIRKHSKGFSPNLFIHWLSIVIYLLLIIILMSILKFNTPDLSINNLGKNGNTTQSIANEVQPNAAILTSESYGKISFGKKISIAEKAIGEKAIIENGNNPEGITIFFKKYPGIIFTTDAKKVIVRADIKKTVMTQGGNIYIGMPVSNLKALFNNLKIEQQRDEDGTMQREYSIVSSNGESAIKFIEMEKSRIGNRVVYSGLINDIIAGMFGYIEVGENFD